MEIKGKIIVVTGAANGIGAALARRFALAGAEALLLCDLDSDGARDVAADLDLPEDRRAGVGCDVADREEVQRLVDMALARFGRIDLFCSNAGILAPGDETAPVAEWQRAWDVNVMAHVHAAQAVLPSMLERGAGYLLNTVSAAGLLTSLGAAPYAVSKHAALAFSEWLAVTYGGKGIGVSALCPQAVRTKMIAEAAAAGAGAAVSSGGNLLEAEEVVDSVIAGLADERFLILPHPETARYAEAKARDIDRWIAGMRRLLPPDV